MEFVKATRSGGVTSGETVWINASHVNFFVIYPKFSRLFFDTNAANSLDIEEDFMLLLGLSEEEEADG